MFKDEKISVSPLMKELMGTCTRRIREGVYVECGFNFHNFLEDMPDHGESYYSPIDGEPPPYGVADSVDQFMELYEEFINSSRNLYAVGFTEVRRDEQPDEGGWRWHKWGPYVGTQTPTVEYLHDEREITNVVTFSVVRRTVKQQAP